jgi:magnesium-transporting ATPase (P-type)
VVRGLLFSYLPGFAFFFSANHDVIASLLESVPLVLTGGVICGTWRFINWEPAHPTPHLFSRKGFWSGLIAGFVPWLFWGFALTYADLPKYTGPLKGLEFMRFQFFILFIVGLAALANAAAGSIARYTLWRANRLPHRSLGAFGLVLIVIAFALQAVQPGIDILNQIK